MLRAVFRKTKQLKNFFLNKLVFSRIAHKELKIKLNQRNISYSSYQSHLVFFIYFSFSHTKAFLSEQEGNLHCLFLQNNAKYINRAKARHKIMNNKWISLVYLALSFRTYIQSTLGISNMSGWSLPKSFCISSSQYKRSLDSNDGHGRSQGVANIDTRLFVNTVEKKRVV